MHVAIVLDGNRRYARKKGMEAWKGHEFGVKKVEGLLEWCRDLGVNELTLYSFSMGNFKRPGNEKKALFRLFNKNFERLENDGKLMENGIKVRFVGRIGMFPKEIQEKMHSLMDKTSKNNKFFLNFAMAYSSKAEITDSIKKIIRKANDKELDLNKINEKMINDNLYLTSKPDIFIRPGGEKRMSDFLLWQSAYSELFFLDKLWPEIEKEDLAAVMDEFRQRERRFGK